MTSTKANCYALLDNCRDSALFCNQNMRADIIGHARQLFNVDPDEWVTNETWPKIMTLLGITTMEEEAFFTRITNWAESKTEALTLFEQQIVRIHGKRSLGVM